METVKRFSANIKHIPFYNIFATPTSVLLNLNFAFTEHFRQLRQKPLVPLDGHFKFPGKDRFFSFFFFTLRATEIWTMMMSLTNLIHFLI